MKKNVWIFGLVIGTILSANMLVMVNMMYEQENFKSGEIVGYASMVVLFSLIFFGVRNYRNKYLNGIISFGKAFKTGFLIALIGSTMYVVTWLFCYYLFVPDFMDVYAAYALENCEPADLAAKTKELETYKELYEKPLFVVLITYSEVLPIGIIVALISALVLKKKRKNVIMVDDDTNH